MPDPIPPRPSLATLLRQPARPAPERTDDAAPADAGARARDSGVGPDAGTGLDAGTDVGAASAPAPAPTPASVATPASQADTDVAAAVTVSPPAPPAADAEAEADASAPIAPRAGAPTSALQPGAREPDAEPAPAPSAVAAPPGASAAPSFMRQGRTRRPVLRAAPWQWIALVGLCLLLGLQILVADRQRLGADARWRPWVAGVCQALRCSLPPWREPSAFTMLSREVRPLPGRAGTLQVQATFRNDARWAQAWPLLQLSLADADGRTIGSRVLRPEDYLGRDRPDAATLAPGQSAQVAFQVREPAAGTAAFSFDFH